MSAVQSGSVMAGLSLLLILPAALLIRDGVLPENSVSLSAFACSALAALVSECAFFSKRRGGYAYIPLSALIAALILLLLGACIPMNGWNFGSVDIISMLESCVMSVAF